MNTFSAVSLRAIIEQLRNAHLGTAFLLFPAESGRSEMMEQDSANEKYQEPNYEKEMSSNANVQYLCRDQN